MHNAASDIIWLCFQSLTSLEAKRKLNYDSRNFKKYVDFGLLAVALNL